ncbi:DNA repair protein SWI5 like protein [Dictyocoela muelleri]|nr:DNA repair protein SWI5 like protein [Dictyocoela muelleri]
MIFDDWKKTPIIHKNKIKEFEFLMENNYITELDDNYFYLSETFAKIENHYYKNENEKLIQLLKIKDVDVELKNFIMKMNIYNEVKDISQSMMGKIAELRGVTNKEIHEEMDVLSSDE